ncbi:MAG: hypothetical protein CALGDGBN_03293 [Pseudomonadales bacterium]|nr:hypothetical protein [Pseudomonadales bacterium]
MSKYDNANIWGIHAGKTGDADTLFRKSKCIAVGWKDFGDLSKILANRDAFKSKYASVYLNAKPGAIANCAGQLYRFAHEMKEGDLVVYPSKAERRVHIGEIQGPYYHEAGPDEPYPNRRSVKWLCDLPRTQFTQGALYEMGSAMSLFLIRNYADEIRAAIDGKPKGTISVTQDETVPAVAEDIEETTRDFILKKLSQDLKGHPFADFVAHLLNTMGYQTRVSPEGADGGIDIVAHRDELGLEPPIIKVQVKSGDGNVGDPAVSSLYGKVSNNEYGLLVTLSTFTAQAKSFARTKSNLRLIDGNELIDLIFRHYDRFDSLYKSIIPLKRVYVPEVMESSPP